MISVPHIFICYRRDDTAGHTGRLRDALSAEFGSDEIFRDLDTISPGDDFVEAMSHGVASCSGSPRWIATAAAVWTIPPITCGASSPKRSNAACG